MREIRLSGSEGGGPNPIESPYPYFIVLLQGKKNHSTVFPRGTLSEIMDGHPSAIHSQKDSLDGVYAAWRHLLTV